MTESWLAGRASPSLDRTAAELVDAFEVAIPGAAVQTADAILAEIPAYARGATDAFVVDLRANTELMFGVMVRALRGEGIGPEDFAFVRAPMARRAQNGLTVADYLHAYRLGLQVAWRTIRSAVRDPTSSAAALSLVEPALDYINLSSTIVATAFSEVEQVLAAAGECARRDLLEDLLAGRTPPPGARGEALRAAGLAADRSHVVISAFAMSADVPEQHALYAAARALGRAAGGGPAPLAVLREDEVVAIVPVDRAEMTAIADGLRSVRAKLSDQHLVLGIGVSTIVDGLAGLAAAYLEASIARARATDERPVFCLFELTAFDYLMLTADGTARRLIDPDVSRFVREDLSNGGVLTTTLLEYAASDLSTKAAAERLYVHVNTAHARLTRIAERTGRDLRKLDDVNELIIAVELARADG